MTEEQFDINSFQNKVLVEIDNIKKRNRKDSLISVVLWLLTPFSFGIFKPPVIVRKRKTEQAEKGAKEIVARKDIKKYLCPGLQSVSNDAYEIAKAITPILVTLSLTRTVQIPLEPVLYAMTAMIISRMGIASLCVDHPKEPENKD